MTGKNKPTVTESGGKGDWPRPRQVSREEFNLRWDYSVGKTILTEEEFNKRIQEIRERTGKP